MGHETNLTITETDLLSANPKLRIISIWEIWCPLNYWFYEIWGIKRLAKSNSGIFVSKDFLVVTTYMGEEVGPRFFGKW